MRDLDFLNKIEERAGNQSPYCHDSSGVKTTLDKKLRHEKCSTLGAGLTILREMFQA